MDSTLTRHEPFQASLVRPSVTTAIVVGILLTAVNQWPKFRDGPYDRRLVLHLFANCAVPFGESAYSRWSATRELR